MKAWCEQCGKYVDYTQEITHTEAFDIKGTRFNVSQTYGICPVCGEEVLSNTIEDQNVHRAHNAYRRALGSITAEEIQGILDRYNIGAHPLSLLLGWGANTIERQMKHTIPDREHAKRLQELKNPSVMYELLEKNRDRISDVAYKKALKAVLELFEFDVGRQTGSFTFKDAFSGIDPSLIYGLIAFSGALAISKRKVYFEEYKPSYTPYQLAISGR